MVKVQVVERDGGLRWEYTNTKGDKLSILCAKDSYGYEKGLFEVQCSWKLEPINGVYARQSFGDVDRFIYEIQKREL